MRVSAKAEYACIAMIELAACHNSSQPLRVKAIAEAQGIPQRFLVQILLQLKTGGLVASLRGSGGGYQLARSPDRISLADIIRAIDREPSTWEDGNPQLSPAAHALHTVWKEINHEELRILESSNLADLVRRAREANAVSYQI